MNKLDEITHLLDFHCVDIAGVTETWLSDTVPPSITTIDGYSCERRDRVEKKGGGVLAYIRENIPYNRWVIWRVMMLSLCGYWLGTNVCPASSHIF